MAIVFDILSASGILAITVYGALLVWRNLQENRLATHYYGLELELLDEQLKRQQQITRTTINRTQDAWEGFRKFELRGKVLEADGICSFYLAPHDGKPLPAFHPGQYLTFKINLQDEQKPLIRCYSLSDSPTHPDYYRVTIKHERPPTDRPDLPPGKSSSYFHQLFNPDDIIDVKAPSGHFYLDMDHNNPVVLIGGGIGITPVLSMLNTLIVEDSNREIWFFYGARDGSEIIMKEHFAEIAREHPNIRINLCFSRPRDQDKQGEDYHHHGRITVDLFRELLPSNNYDYYICGPAPLMDSITQDLGEWGVPREKIHFEAFGPATVKSARDAGHNQEGEAENTDTRVNIQLKRSNKKVGWSAPSGSILECAEAVGAQLESGCRAGNCGACEVAIIEGEVEYPSPPGAPVATGSCLTCVAVPRTDLILDA